MPVSGKTNLAEALAGFGLTANELQKTMESGLVEGMRFFERKMIKEQFSGRPGLKRKSGQAASSWRINKYNRGTDDFAVSLSNSPTAWYIVVHQHAKGFTGTIRHPGGTPYLPYHVKYEGKFIPLHNSWKGMPGVKLTKPHDIKIPKRLHITEDFEKEGYGIIVKSVLARAKRTIESRKQK